MFKKRLLLFVMMLLILALGINALGVSSLDETKQPRERDRRVYCTATLDEQFADDSVTVVINKSNSKINKSFSKSNFKGISATEIKDLSLVEGNASKNQYINTEDFQQILEIKLAKTGKEQVLKAIKELKKLDFIESAEPNYYFIPDDFEEAEKTAETEEIFAGDPVDDLVVPNTTAPNDSNYGSQYALPKICAPAAWDITKGSTTIKVGIIDSGISNHSDLNGNLASGWDFYNNNCITNDVNNYPHGTHVAGIIGAVGNNAIGISGVNWSVTLVPLQVVITDGSTSDGMFDGNAIIQAINYAQNNDIPIINCSFGSLRSYFAYETQMRNYKGLIVCSAGNGKDHDNNPNTPNVPVDTDIEPHDPSCSPLDNIISVASTDGNDVLAPTSNYGATSVDLAAPGVSIYSTLPGNTYGYKSGTSMAAPYVAGAAALIKSRYPVLSTDQIKAAILNGVDTVSSLSGKVKTNGRLNIYNSLVYLQSHDFIGTNTVTGDFNGDGKEDIAMFNDYGHSDTGIGVRLSTGSGYTEEKCWFRSGWGNFGVNNFTRRITCGDYDGDNVDEIAVFYSYSDGTVRIIVCNPQGEQFINQTWMTYPPGAFGSSRIDDLVISGDYDGDNQDEIALFYTYNDNSMKIFVYNQTSPLSFQAFTWQTFAPNTFSTESAKGCLISGDYDGDNQDEIAVLYGYSDYSMKVIVFSSTSPNSFLNFLWMSCPAGTFDTDLIRGRIASGDFNADGKDDITSFYSYSDGSVKVFDFRSTGTAFQNFLWCELPPGSFNANKITGRVSAGDYDANGREEIIVLYDYGNFDFRILLYFSVI